MFSISAFVAALLLALDVVANPIVIRDSPISLPFTTRINATITFKGLLQHDRERVKSLRARADTKAGGLSSEVIAGLPATNLAVVYTASVGIGSPPTQYDLLIDTGSSNTWLGSGKAYVRTKSSIETTNLFEVEYGSGFVLGIEYLDKVTLSDRLVITNQSLGVAAVSDGFSGYDGVLGLGPVILTTDTLAPDMNATVPTVTDNLFSQRSIPADQVAVSFEPTTEDSVTNGEITFGGTNPAKFKGAISYANLTSTYPASDYWGLNQSITYDSANGTTILASTAGIVDTGTTLTLLASDALAIYANATGASLDEDVGLYSITTSQYANLKSLFFNIGGNAFELTPNAQIWPRALNTYLGGDADKIYLVVGDIGTDSGSGLDFINGYTFLERFYSVFDTGKQRIGFASTPFTNATSN